MTNSGTSSNTGLIIMLCVLGIIVVMISESINTVEIQVTQVDIDNFRQCTIIYDHGGESKMFWGTEHGFEVGKIYRVTYKAGTIHPSIIKIEEIS